MKTPEQIKEAKETFAQIIKTVPADLFDNLEKGCLMGAADALNWVLGDDAELAATFEGNIKRAQSELAVAAIVRNLNFSKIEGRPPKLTCHHCGKQNTAAGWLAAEILLDETLDAVVIVACSQVCAQAFKTHPAATAYVRDVLAKVEKMRG